MYAKTTLSAKSMRFACKGSSTFSFAVGILRRKATKSYGIFRIPTRF